MKNLLFILAVSCTILPTFSQRDQELFCINDTPVLVPEFKQVYEKNLPLVEDGKGESKIEEIYQLLESGASFEKLANEYSDDLGSANNGGKLPRFGTGEMLEKFENEVIKLEK